MRILNITAQKPNSTGSGVYLTELMKGFAQKGHEQALIAGVYKEETVELSCDISFYPVEFHTPKLPFPIAGMSDEMPYESTVYSDMTEDMVLQLEAAFTAAVRTAEQQFRPELIICHHLYFVTAIVRHLLPNHWVCGFCHNTDLRQMKKHSLKKDYICSHIRALDAIFTVNEEQREEVIHVYGVQPDQVRAVGTGYNPHIFYESKQVREDVKTRLIFAGKLSEKKGVMSLLRSLSYLKLPPEKLELYLAGSSGNQKEYKAIQSLAGSCPYPVIFLGRLSQTELAAAYNQCDIFVLPSFCEGMPLTLIEALACGNKAVMTDLPGICSWISQNAKGAQVVYVEPPDMCNTDEPCRESLPEFEERLAEKLVECMKLRKVEPPDLSGISWERICDLVVEQGL